MSEQTVLEAIKKLHSPETRYQVESCLEMSFESEGEAREYEDSPEDITVTFTICSHCGPLEAGDDGDNAYRDSMWPCYTAVTWLWAGE
jgi:hypothetical protein